MKTTLCGEVIIHDECNFVQQRTTKLHCSTANRTTVQTWHTRFNSFAAYAFLSTRAIVCLVHILPFYTLVIYGRRFINSGGPYDTLPMCINLFLCNALNGTKSSLDSSYRNGYLTEWRNWFIVFVDKTFGQRKNAPIVFLCRLLWSRSAWCLIAWLIAATRTRESRWGSGVKHCYVFINWLIPCLSTSSVGCAGGFGLPRFKVDSSECSSLLGKGVGASSLSLTISLRFMAWVAICRNTVVDRRDQPMWKRSFSLRLRSTHARRCLLMRCTCSE